MKTCQDFAVEGQQMHCKEPLLLFSQSGRPAQERAGGTSVDTGDCTLCTEDGQIIKLKRSCSLSFSYLQKSKMHFLLDVSAFPTHLQQITGFSFT